MSIMITKQERQTLTLYLPLLKQIKNRNIRERVIEIWARLWRASAYPDLREAPNYLSDMDGDETLLRHTNAVARMTLATAREFQKAYSAQIDFDRLIAGALLHDVDKLVLYKRQGNAVCLNELGKKSRHGEYGAQVVRKVGLSEEIANVLACHSPAQDKVEPATIEAVLLKSCDTGNFQCYRLMKGEGLWHKPNRKEE